MALKKHFNSTTATSIPDSGIALYT